MNQNNQFDAIIIGFGKGGKSLAVFLGNKGMRTALIEKSPKMYGGTCINVGCIPSKILIQKSKKARSLTSFKEKSFYYQQSVEEKNLLIEKLRRNNLKKVQSSPNVTVITGLARLKSSTEVEVKTVNGLETFYGKQIFINTGSVPIIPNINGIKNNSYVVTSEELLRQTRLPNHLVIIGGGYIGIEFASMYANFGSKVTIIQNGSLFLPREDRDVSKAIYDHIQYLGINILLDVEVESIEQNDSNAILNILYDNNLIKMEADTILVATGRKPNIEELGLENVNIELTERGGIQTDEHRLTNENNIYAMGDVVGELQFTYISLDDFRVVSSALFDKGTYTINNRGSIPYSLFIDPPFSRIGLSEEEAISKGYDSKIFYISADSIPKSLIIGQTTGFLKVIVDKKTNLIIGAHLFLKESPELINVIKIVMDAKLPYTILRDNIYTHPTICESFNELFKE